MSSEPSERLNFYDNGRIVPERLRDEIRRQQHEAASEWTTSEFHVPWTTAWDFARLAETLARYSVVKCRECGQTYDTASTVNGVAMAQAKVCFICDFWSQKVRMADDGDLSTGNRVARIKGHHYVVAPDQSDRGSAGCGGREFRVRWTAGPHEGVEVVTHNLWVQGEIPAHFRDRLPDNAEFPPRPPSVAFPSSVVA